MQLLNSPSREVQQRAATVLRNLCGDVSKVVQQACIRSAAAAALLRLLHSSAASMAAQEQAAIALDKLASCHVEHRRAIVAQPGSIDTLQRLLTNTDAAQATVDAVLSTLRHLVFDELSAQVATTIPAVLQCLRSRHADVATQAAALLNDLTRYDDSSRRTVIAAGGIPALAAVVHGSALKAVVNAAGGALRCVALGNRQVATCVVRALGIPVEQELVQLFVDGAPLSPEPGFPTALISLPTDASSYRRVHVGEGRRRPCG